MLNLHVFDANLRVQNTRVYDVEPSALGHDLRPEVLIHVQACSAASRIEYVLSSFSMKRTMPQFKSKSISRRGSRRGSARAAMLELIASVVAPTPGFAGRNEYNKSEACTATGRRVRLSFDSLQAFSDTSPFKRRGEIFANAGAHDLHERSRLAGTSDRDDLDSRHDLFDLRRDAGGIIRRFGAYKQGLRRM